MVVVVSSTDSLLSPTSFTLFFRERLVKETGDTEGRAKEQGGRGGEEVMEGQTRGVRGGWAPQCQC